MQNNQSDADYFRQQMQANPGLDYGQQATNAGKYLAGLPGKTGDLLFGVADAARDTFGRNAGAMRLGNEPQANTKQDATNALSQTFSGIGALGNQLTNYFGNSARAGGLMQPAQPAAGLQPQTTTQTQTPLMVNQQSQSLKQPPALGNQPVNNAFRQATPENVPARLGNNGQVQFTNPNGLGSGSMDFGSPEQNARMAQKIQAGRGTLNVGSGFFNAQNFADSIRANTVGQVGQALRAGNISSSEAQQLMMQAKQGGEPEQFLDPQQAALQQKNQQFNQTLQQNNQQFQDNQALEREKLAQGLGNNVPNKYALNPQGQAYPTQGEAGDRYFQQQQERGRIANKAQQVVSALDGKFFLDDSSKKQLNAARAWLEANGQV